MSKQKLSAAEIAERAEEARAKLGGVLFGLLFGLAFFASLMGWV